MNDRIESKSFAHEEMSSGIVVLAHGRFRLGLAPGLGGSLTHLDWSNEDGQWIPLMRRGGAAEVAGGNASRLASFVMVPFTNRIDGGRIPVTGAEAAHVPINRPTQNVAIHGFGRAAPWTILERSAARIVLEQRFAEAGNPYVYRATQTFELRHDTVTGEVAVTNLGDRPLPFGIGFHPWFDRTPAATLSLSARHAFRMDERDMPVAAIPIASVFGDDLDISREQGRHRMVIAARTPFDTPLSGWDGVAELTWPERRLRLTIEGLDALKLVHIFSPRTSAGEAPVFCVEPVSHLPDVVNRQPLASHGDMALLAPGDSLSGAMRLVPASLP